MPDDDRHLTPVRGGRDDRRTAGTDRRSDPGTRSRIVELEFRYRRVAHRLTIAIGIIGITITALTVISIALIRENKDRAEQIQQQRTASIRANCLEQNARHDNSVAALTKGAAQDEANAPTEKAKAEVRRRRDVTIALLDALAPPRDCKRLVARSVRSVS